MGISPREPDPKPCTTLSGSNNPRVSRFRGFHLRLFTSGPFRGRSLRASRTATGGSVLRTAPTLNRSSADFQVCCIVGFQTRQPCAPSQALPIWKSAIQQVWKPALHRGIASSQSLRKNFPAHPERTREHMLDENLQVSTRANHDCNGARPV